MSRKSKLLDRLKSRPRDFTWSEACTLMAANGFEEQSGSGSRYKFVHSSGRLVSIHKPHPGNELKRYQVDDLIIALKEVGVITDE